MNGTAEPATARQLDYLKEHGYTPEHPLSKWEAVELIRSLFAHPGVVPHESRGPVYYRERVEGARQLLESACISETAEAQRALEAAIAHREEFWLDTCRDASELPHSSPEAWELYRVHGCLFCSPTHMQVRAVLEALDHGVPKWDSEHPELFYETLQLNFPELLKRV